MFFEGEKEHVPAIECQSTIPGSQSGDGFYGGNVAHRLESINRTRSSKKYLRKESTLCGDVARKIDGTINNKEGFWI